MAAGRNEEGACWTGVMCWGRGQGVGVSRFKITNRGTLFFVFAYTPRGTHVQARGPDDRSRDLARSFFVASVCFRGR